MIWFRRILTIPVIISFILLLIFVLLITQVNDTLLNPGFYNDQMRQADMYNFVYDELLPVALDEVEEEMETDDPSDFDMDISAIEDELVSAARKILPPEWLQDQVESATNSVIPYFLGDTDEFTYTIALRDRIDTAVEVINEDIVQGDAFISIYDDGMSYLADELFDELPSSLMLSKAEIEDSLRTVVSQGWIISQLEAAIDSVVPYMTGDSNHFTITINLQDIYTDDALLDLLGVGNEAFLDEARDWISEGWTFTDADLLDNLDSDDQQTLEDVRGWIASGYTVTEADLREAISDTEEDFDFFDDARHWVGTGRTWLWALWLIPLIFLIAIGFLSGRSWKSRLAWALAVLFLTSLTVYIVTVMAYAAVGEPGLQEIMLDPLEYEGIDAVMAEKGNEMIENVASGFVSGLKSRALYITIGSAVVLLGVITWSVVSRRRRPFIP